MAEFGTTVVIIADIFPLKESSWGWGVGWGVVGLPRELMLLNMFF